MYKPRNLKATSVEALEQQAKRLAAKDIATDNDYVQNPEFKSNYIKNFRARANKVNIDAIK